MQKTNDGKPAMHLGDGLYAVHNGYSIELRPNHHENAAQAVHMDLPYGLELLNKFHEQVMSEATSKTT